MWKFNGGQSLLGALIIWSERDDEKSGTVSCVPVDTPTLYLWSWATLKLRLQDGNGNLCSY